MSLILRLDLDRSFLVGQVFGHVHVLCRSRDVYPTEEANKAWGDKLTYYRIHLKINNSNIAKLQETSTWI